MKCGGPLSKCRLLPDKNSRITYLLIYLLTYLFTYLLTYFLTDLITHFLTY